MDAYIDFKNFCSYVHSLTKDDEENNDYFRRRFDLKFSFSEDKLHALQEEDERVDLWINQDAQGGNYRTREYECHLPRPLDDKDFFENRDTSRLSALYMLDGEEAKELAARGGLLIAPVGEELETLRKLMIRYEDGNGKHWADDRMSKTFRARAIKNWMNVDLNANPCTDIIIADRYFFSQPCEDLQKNVFPLLRILMKNAKDLAVNIVVFAEKIINDKINKREYPIPLEWILSEISQLSHTKPNFTFVEIADNTIHGREIITNYLTIVSSNSFGTYFRKDRDEKGVADMFSLYSVVHPDLGQILRYEDIEELQRIINNPDTRVFGDGKSNFFTFNNKPFPFQLKEGDIVRFKRDNKGNVFYGDAMASYGYFETHDISHHYLISNIVSTKEDSPLRAKYPQFISKLEEIKEEVQ